ncbi:MAG: AI-2E family transporter [Bacteroidales bacterium]
MPELRPADQQSGRHATDRQSGWQQTVAVLRAILVIAGVAALAWLLYAVRSVLLLLALSVFFAYLLAPLVALVQRPRPLYGRQRRLSPGLAVGVVYLLLFGIIAVVLGAVGPQVSEQSMQLIGQAPTFVKAAEARGEQIVALLDRLGLPPAARSAALDAVGQFAGTAEASAAHAGGLLLGLASYLPWLVLIPILAFFLLKDADTFRTGLVRLMPEGRARGHAAALFQRINVVLAAYVRAQLLACLLVAIVVAIGFAVLGVPYAIVLGALAGLAEFIPLVGPLALAVLAALIAAFHQPILGLWVLVFLGALRVVEDYIVYPRLVGGGMHLHPLAIIVAVLAGAELGGVPGIFLAVPAVAILIVIFRYFRETGERPSLADRRLA